MDSSGGSGLPLNSSENDDRGLSFKAVRMVCTASDAESDSFTTTSNIDVMRETRTGMDAISHDAHEGSQIRNDKGNENEKQGTGRE